MAIPRHSVRDHSLNQRIPKEKEKLEKFLYKKGKTEEDSNELKKVLKNDILVCEKAIQEYQKIIDKLNT